MVGLRRGRKTDVRSQKTEDRSQGSEDREQRTDVRSQRTDTNNFGFWIADFGLKDMEDRSK
jgi:hypothetical protein